MNGDVEDTYIVSGFTQFEKPDFPKTYNLNGKDFSLKEALFNVTDQKWTAYYRCKYYRKPHCCSAKCRLIVAEGKITFFLLYYRNSKYF